MVSAVWNPSGLAASDRRLGMVWNLPVVKKQKIQQHQDWGALEYHIYGTIQKSVIIQSYHTNYLTSMVAIEAEVWQLEKYTEFILFS